MFSCDTDPRLASFIRRAASFSRYAPASVLVGAFMVFGPAPAFGQVPLPPDRPSEPGSLKQVAVPVPANLSLYVRNKQAAIVLGKALFWDIQSGSDGLACASCHFHAGADNRVKNQLDPGLRNENGIPLSQAFNKTASNKNLPLGPPPGGGPNYTLRKADFPFHQLADPTDRNSTVIADTDDVASSQGVFTMNMGNVVTHEKLSLLRKNPHAFCSADLASSMWRTSR